MRVNHALALDALESVRFSPTSSLLWQRLATLINTLEARERAVLVAAIAALPLAQPLAQWLRCSALASVTRDPAWLVQQAGLVDDQFTADAVMSLLGMAWYHALVGTPGHAGFVQLLRGMDAPRLQRLAAARMSGRGPARTDAPRARLRVAVYTPEVSNSRHGGTMLTLNTMGVLLRQGVELHGFSAKEASIPAIGSYHGGTQALSPLPVDAQSLKLADSGNVQFSFPSAEFSLRARFDQVLQAIDAYAPDLVVFVGLLSPLVYRLHAHYPVVGLSVHALPPVAPVDVWLSADAQGEAACWPGVPVPRVFHFPFRFQPMGQAAPLDRAALGLPADATLLVTAGFRLDTEIAAPWSGHMLAFVEAHPDVHWLLIGIPNGEQPGGLPQHPRIHCVAPQPELAPWLAMCDIYANPPRVGGGGSLAMAMEQGLAVATFAGGDGGDKVGGYAVNSIHAYFALLHGWAVDAAARQLAGNELEARFHARLDFSADAAAAGLMQACELAMESFRQRRGAPSA